jgi:hypothetical protein
VRIFLLALFILGGPGALASSPNPTLHDLSAAAKQGKVSVRMTLNGAFANREMVEALQSGLPTTITYTVEVFRDRPNWFDDDIDEARVEVICTFNSLTREYLLNYRRDGRLIRSQTFHELGALERAMTHIEEADFFDIGRRKPYKLKVRARAELMTGWLMYVIPWQVSTSWREARVRTPEPAERAGER